jgi:hypothetical protein
VNNDRAVSISAATTEHLTIIGFEQKRMEVINGYIDHIDKLMDQRYYFHHQINYLIASPHLCFDFRHFH